MQTINATKRQVIGRIYQEVRLELFSIFRQACISEDTCQDLVHDVFIKIMGIDDIVISQLKALAVVIAYQKRTDYLRHRAYINKVRNDMQVRDTDRIYTQQDTEIKELLNAEMRVVNGMSELDGKAYMLSRFEQKSADEIALTLNLSKRAVESRIYRTRMLVRNNLRRAI